VGGSRSRLLLGILLRDYAEDLRRVNLESFGGDTLAYDLVQAQLHGLWHEPEPERAYYDSLRAVLETRIQSRSQEAPYHSVLAMAYAGLGRNREAVREAERAVELRPVSRDAFMGPLLLQILAETESQAGDHDSALEHITVLLSRPSWLSVPLLRVDPTFDPLRDDPRFQELLGKEAPVPKAPASAGRPSNARAPSDSSRRSGP
jgi:tetratricopeptide (TPR) repeat protein